MINEFEYRAFCFFAISGVVAWSAGIIWVIVQCVS